MEITITNEAKKQTKTKSLGWSRLRQIKFTVINILLNGKHCGSDGTHVALGVCDCRSRVHKLQPVHRRRYASAPSGRRHCSHLCNWPKRFIYSN